MRAIWVAPAVIAAMLVPATGAGAAEVPDINCGIVSCTYPVEKKLDEAREAVAGPTDCVEAAVEAIRQILQGTPQPQECDPV